MKPVAVFTRSYPGDKEFLPYMYRSLEKFFPEFREAVLVVERRHIDEMLPFVPSFVKIRTEDSFAPGTIQHKYSKLTADIHTECDYVMHVDSDCIFTRRVDDDMLFAASGRPYLEYASYAHLHAYERSEDFVSKMKEYFRIDVLPNEMMKWQLSSGKSSEEARKWVLERLHLWVDDHFASWFEQAFKNWRLQFGMCVWESGTSYAMGKTVLNEYSRRVEKIFPREVYPIARRHIWKTHRMSLRNFIVTRTGKQDLSAKPVDYFSDLNFIGAVLDEFLHDHMEWVNIEHIELYHRPQFMRQYISYDSFDGGVLKDSIRKEMEEILE
jgi:hypothetical protein